MTIDIEKIMSLNDRAAQKSSVKEVYINIIQNLFH